MIKNQTTNLYLVIILLMIGSGSSVLAQDNISTAAQMVEIGDEIYNQTMAIMEARELYITAVNMDGNNVRANYMAGITTLQSIDKGAATAYFLKVLELDPNYSFDILYKIGRAYHYDYKFDDAMNYYSRYQQKIAGTEIPGQEFATAEEADRKMYECEQGKIMVEFPEEVEIRNVGEGINSPDADYAPVLNQNEDLLIFTSRRQDGNLNSDVASDNYPYEDIFVATRADTTWSSATNIDQPVNTLYHDSNVGLSKDGTTLYLYKDDNGGDIFETKRDATGAWSEPEPMGKPINTEYQETTVSVTPDGQTLFFASDRRGGHGGLDIWITKKDRKGDWDDPINLGDEINTKYNEDGPFIGYDGKTLYFSSEGGEGMGGFDIYRVVYDSAAQAWGPPENMGYPINTPDHDIYFVPTADGKQALYSSVRDDGFGNTDIYVLTIPEDIQHHEQTEIPSPNVKLVVTVLNQSDEPIDAILNMTQIDGPDKLFASKLEDGVYQFVSNPAVPRAYTLEAVVPGYELNNTAVTLPEVGDADKMIEMTVTMALKEEKKETPPPPPPPVVVTSSSKQLRNIYFAFNSAWVASANKDKLNKVADYLKTNPNSKMIFVGHSDYIGAEKYNAGLSLKRANNIKTEIIKLGIDASRIQTKGEGYKFPLASNDDEKEGRELNRRVEFKVIK